MDGNGCLSFYCSIKTVFFFLPAVYWSLLVHLCLIINSRYCCLREEISWKTDNFWHHQCLDALKKNRLMWVWLFGVLCWVCVAVWSLKLFFPVMWHGITSFDILGNKTHCKYIHKPYLCHLCIFSALLMNSSRILSLVAWICIALNIFKSDLLHPVK